ARAHGALGPIGRASGLAEDARQSRPYGPYDLLGFEPAAVRSAGDALARQQVRLEEVSESLRLVCGALEALDDMGEGPWQVPLEVPDGFALGSVEAPQGELLYLIEVEGGRLVRGRARCPSFHNLALLPMAFNGDIYTDFVFIEASFALSMAGVSR
ncbi:MAG: NADH-quinone oxidoreductase subunit D, partial [Acidimicrobiales bacterium]